MTELAALSLADLTAAVARLTPLHAASEEFIELVWVGRAYMQEPVPTSESKAFYAAAHELMPLLLSSANRLPGVVEELERATAAGKLACADVLDMRSHMQMVARERDVAIARTAALESKLEAERELAVQMVKAERINAEAATVARIVAWLSQQSNRLYDVDRAGSIAIDYVSDEIGDGAWRDEEQA